jgi:pyruvate dehydrogenase E2 component (dihydrolipoamide acetyltransferase)
MESVTVLRWLVGVNDRVEADQPILEVETQKATIDVPSPTDGFIRKLCVNTSDEISEKTLLCLLTDAADEPVTLNENNSPSTAARSTDRKASAETIRELGPEPTSSTASDGGPVRAAPAARRLAKDLGVDLQSVTGTGPNGRIAVEDVRRAATTSSTPGEPTAGQDDWTPLSARRLALIDQMQRSLAKIPQIHVTRQLDVTRLAVKSPLVTFTHRLISAVGKALVQHPALRTVLDQNRTKVLSVSVAVAMDTPHGLVAPVLRQADLLTLQQISESVRELAGRAESNRLKRAELTDGPFAITNLGMLGVDFFNAFVFDGQTAVLAVGRATQGSDQKTAWFSLAADHRIVDGAEAARFLQTLQQEITRQ